MWDWCVPWWACGRFWEAEGDFVSTGGLLDEEVVGLEMVLLPLLLETAVAVVAALKCGAWFNSTLPDPAPVDELWEIGVGLTRQCSLLGRVVCGAVCCEKFKAADVVLD